MLPNFLRKPQVSSERTFELVFPRDITQLHLMRTTPPHETKVSSHTVQQEFRKTSRLAG